MNNWNSGYVTDLGYTYGYFSELNPQNASLALLRCTIEPPDVINACELGFGQGVSINVNSSTSSTNWYGTDFNPLQASFAVDLAKQVENGAQLFDQSFSEFCLREDLPDFDFICLHGVWSWTSDDNRSLIINFIKNKLKLGGIVYLSYNAYPGAANFLAARHLLVQHVKTYGSISNGLSNNIRNSLNFMSEVMNHNPRTSVVNPTLKKKLDSLTTQNTEYLSHEYYNADWTPMHFSDVHEALSNAKLEYACPASYTDSVDPLHFTDEQQKLIAQIIDPVFKETTRDFLVNKLFRKDYWIKGKRTLSHAQIKERIRKQNLTLVVNCKNVPMKVTGARGTADLPKEIFSAILKHLINNQTIKFGDLEEMLVGKNINFNELLQAIFVLVGLGCVTSSTTTSEHRHKIDSLNKFITTEAKSSGNITYLISPITGTAINVSRFEILFIKALNEGYCDKETIAKFVWAELVDENERLLKDGKPLISVEENLEELEMQATKFMEEEQDTLVALGIVNPHKSI